MMPRQPIAEAVAHGGKACVAGRVLVLRDEAFWIADASGQIAVRLPADEGAGSAAVRPAEPLCAGSAAVRPAKPLRAGDIVRVVGHVERGRGSFQCQHVLVAEEITLLTPYRAQKPFPNPGGENWRLSPARRAALVARSRGLAAIREFFGTRGFIEVETPLRVGSPGLEVHLQAMPSGDRWLITSPEYHMKRLLVGGLERIYQMCKCFRGGEVGSHHNSEFTMLEWYRAYAGWEDILKDTEELCAHVALSLCGSTRVAVRECACDLEPPWERMTVAEAFAR